MKKTKISLAVMLVLSLCVNACASKDDVVFYIDGKEKESAKMTIEYQKDLDMSVKAMKISAKIEGKKVKEKDIKHKKVTIDKLKTYTVEYYVKGYEEDIFAYQIKVEDKTAPELSGVMEYRVNVGESFMKENLEVSAQDVFDGDLTKDIKMDAVDTSSAGVKQVTVSVADSSGNEATATITVHVVDNTSQTGGGSTNQGGAITVSNPNDITVLINKTHKLPDGWAPSDLVSIGGNHYLRSEAAAAWNRLYAVAQADGVNINVVSSYRTQQYQTNLYNNYYANDPAGAPFYSAYPRTSEHELGLALDLSYDYSLHDDLQNSTVGKWLDAHAHEYGFVLRYQPNKTNLTGYMYEAWHYRYVGPSLASTLKSRGIVLEEYY